VRRVTANWAGGQVDIRNGTFQELQTRTRKFALRIVKLFRSVPKTDDARILGKQLLRSGTSIGANYRAACRARSRAEFVAKLGIVLEEAGETAFWLELMRDAEIFPEAKLGEVVQEAKELVAIFVASVKTAKGFTSSI
jgi:four helix bundle protein